MTQEALKTLAEDMPTPLIMFDNAELGISWLNQAAEIWLGQSLRAAVGKPLAKILRSTDEIKIAAARCMKEQGPVSIRGFIPQRPNQSEGHADMPCHITIFPTGTGLGLLVALRESSEQGSRSNEHAVSTIGRMLAHEIKNPLAGIKGAAQLLRDDVTTDEGRTLINLIGSEIERIRRLADRMETLGDRSPANEGRVNIHEVLRDAQTLVQASLKGSIMFTEKYDPSLPEILGDRDTLMQAVLNVIKNASEAIELSGNSGLIILQTTYRAGVSRKIGQGEKGANLPIEIRITDDGPGIPSAIRDQIFQPFVTSKPTGQGLGLALVAKVVAAHNGRVELRSRPGQTVFSIRLPLLQDTLLQN